MNPSHMYSMWPNGQRNINSPSPFPAAAAGVGVAAANYANSTNRLQAVMNAAVATNPYNHMTAAAAYAPSPYDRPNSVSLSRNPAAAVDYASMQKIPNQFSTSSFYNTTVAAHNPYDIYRQNTATHAFTDLNRTNGSSLMGKDPLAHSTSAYSNLFSQGFPTSEPLISGLTARDYSLSLNQAISNDVVNSVFESSLLIQGQQQQQQQQQHQQQQHMQQALQSQQQQQPQPQPQPPPQPAQPAPPTPAQQQRSGNPTSHLDLQQTQQPSPLSQQQSTNQQQPQPQQTSNVRRNSQSAASSVVEKAQQQQQQQAPSRHPSDPYSCQTKVPQAPPPPPAQVNKPTPQQQQQSQLQNPPSVPSHAPGSVDAVAQSPRQPHSITSYHSPAEHTPQTPKTPRILTFSDELRHLATILEKCGSPSTTDYPSKTLDIVSIIEKLSKYTGILKINMETQTSSSCEDELFIVDAEVKEFCTTVPRELVIRASKAPQGGIRLGLWGREEIPSASEFGPFKGRLCQSGTIVPDTADDHWLVRSLRSSNTYYFLPDRNNPPPRWMMFINSGYSEQGIEPNCFLLCQSDNEYIIRVMCSIQPENEVLICVNEDLLPSHLVVSPHLETPKEKNISPNVQSAKKGGSATSLQEQHTESEEEIVGGNISDQVAETDSEMPTPVKTKSKSKKKKKSVKKSQSQTSPVAAKEVVKTIYFEDIPFYITHYACRDCKKYFLECSAYETHRKSYHEDNLPWRCKLCDAIGYKELGKLKSHYKKDHDKDDKVQYFDKCRNEAIELGYQVDFEQDLSEFVDYELFSGSRKLKSKRKLCDKVETSAETEDSNVVDNDMNEQNAVPQKKRARYEPLVETVTVAHNNDVTEMTSQMPEEEEDMEDVSAEIEEVEDAVEMEEEEEMAPEKPKSSSGSKKSGSKKDKSSGKGKKKKGGKKGAGRKSGSSGSSSHRQAVIEISVEDDDGEEIKMKFDDDEDDYLNDEELIQNLDLNTTSVDSDQEFSVKGSSSHSATRKKKKRGAKTKKGKRKTAATRVNYEEAPTPPESPPTPEPLPVKQSSNKRGAKSRQRHTSASTTTPRSPTRSRSRGSNSPGSSSASKRKRSKTPPSAGAKKDSDEKAEKEEIDEQILAQIAANTKADFSKENVTPEKKPESVAVNGLEVSNDASNTKTEELNGTGSLLKMSSPDPKRKPEKKFECYLCLDKFIMVAKFERHMVEVHKIEKPWKCEQCELTFKRYFLMSQHVKIKHVDEENEKDENDDDEGQVSSQSDRLSENDVSGIDQSENDDEVEQQLIRANRANKPVVQYKPLAHFKHKSSLNILPTPVVSSMNMNNNNNNNFRASSSLKKNAELPQNLKEVSESSKQLSINVPDTREKSNVKSSDTSPVKQVLSDKTKLSQTNTKSRQDNLLQPAPVEEKDSKTHEAENQSEVDVATREHVELRDVNKEQEVILEGNANGCSEVNKSSIVDTVESSSDNGPATGKERKRKSKLPRVFTCEHCDPPIEFNQAAKYGRHLAEQHEIKKPFKCDSCLRSFSSQQAVDNHQKRCAAASASGPENNNPTSNFTAPNAAAAAPGGTAEAALRCNKCNIEIKSMKLYTLHMSGDHSTSVPYLCQLCKYQFPRASVLAEHLRSTHNVSVKESQLFPLTSSRSADNPDICTSSTTDVETTPPKNVTDFSDYQMSQRSFVSENSSSTNTVPFLEHPKEEMVLKNAENEKQLQNSSSLNSSVSGAVTSSFSTPGPELAAINTNNAASVNVLGTIGLGKVPTSVVEAPVIGSGVLDKKLKQTQCQICLKWMDKNYFQDHMNLHNGNKPYECDVCKQRFAQRAGLAYHKRNHHSGTSNSSITATATPNTLPPNSATVVSGCSLTTLASTVPPVTVQYPVIPDQVPFTTATGDKVQQTLSKPSTQNVTISVPPQTAQNVSTTLDHQILNSNHVNSITTVVCSSQSQNPTARCESKLMAPGTGASHTTMNAMELILQQNRTILPAKTKPSQTPNPVAPAKTSQHPTSAILIPTSSVGAALQLTNKDGKQSISTNFILTPVKAASATNANTAASVPNEVATTSSSNKSSSSKKSGKSTNTRKKVKTESEKALGNVVNDSGSSLAQPAVATSASEFMSGQITQSGIECQSSTNNDLALVKTEAVTLNSFSSSVDPTDTGKKLRDVVSSANNSFGPEMMTS